MAEKLVLLVEDDPDDMELILHAFSKADLPVKLIVARDGTQALSSCLAPEDSPRPPDLVLLDLHLPKIDGLEVLRRLTSDPQTGTVPVIVLTSSEMEEDLVASYNLGANSYARKPVEFEQFVEAVQFLKRYWLGLNDSMKQEAKSSR